MQCKEVTDISELPEHAEEGVIYRILPSTHYGIPYAERIDRNIGWITSDDQEILRGSTVGIAGCGGMGGLLALTMVRTGIGSIRIADAERFDASNLNRQAAATRVTLGKHKALETARLMRSIAEDCVIDVYPQGITERSAEWFANGCDFIFDEIEFWSIGSRLILHGAARQAGVTVLMGSSVGFGSRIFRFEPDGVSLEDMIGLNLAEAIRCEKSMRANSLSKAERFRLGLQLMRGLIPGTLAAESARTAVERLLNSGIASIIGTNPPLAAGLAANHGLAILLERRGSLSAVSRIPRAPGYGYVDSLNLEARNVYGDDDA